MREDYEPPIELDDVQKEIYNEDHLGEFLAGPHTDNHFGYIIDVFEKCRVKFNHQPHARRTEQDEKFRTASENLLRQTQSPLQAQRQGNWTSAPVVAPLPTMPHNNMEAFPQAQEFLGCHYHVNELQMRSYQASVGGISMPGQDQRPNYHSNQACALLKPQISAHLFRAQNCSSQTSMRSGASSNSYVDIDLLPTPGTSQDGHLDVANTASSASSPLYLPPQAEPGKTGGGGQPSLESPETVLPDQRRPFAPHNIVYTTPVDRLSRPKLAYRDPPVVHSVAWDGRVHCNTQGASHFAESMGYAGEQLADQGTGGWPGSFCDLNPAGIEHQPEVPESWDFSRDASNFEYSGQPDFRSM